MTELRAERPGDAGRIERVLTAAFDGDGEARLVAALRGSAAWLPDLSIVAEDDGQIIAYALLSRIVIAAEPEVPGLALGPVAALPGRQRQGHGTAVVTEALSRVQGFSVITVLGDPAYYRRFGFVPAGRFGITGAYKGFGAAWQALPLTADTAPGEAIYPPAWDDEL